MSQQEAGPVALVTGGSRGIGQAIAVSLGAAGFRVVVNYRTNEDAARACADEVRAAGAEAQIVQADVGRAADRRRLTDDTCDHFGGIDLLVNNAGIASPVRADMLEMGEQNFDHVLNTNLKGPFFLSQLVANRMIEQTVTGERPRGQAIVNIGSISGYTASVNRAEYCVAKAGMGMMTKLFAVRLAEYGIRVYEIRPGIIATDMTSVVKEKYDTLIKEQDLLPIARWGQPQDVAEAVVAIAEGRLPYSTGQVIDVDGGFHLRRL